VTDGWDKRAKVSAGHRCRVLLFAGMIAPLSAVCGDATPQYQTPKTNSCTLLTDRQVSEVVRMKVDQGARDDGGRLEGPEYAGSYSSTCVWRASVDRGAQDPERPLGGASFAILTIIGWPPHVSGPVKFLQTFRDAAQSHDIATTPVPLQIGDEALWWGDGVAARKGNIAFGISVHLVNSRSEERQMEELLAAKIAARL
jgi:hypothetical protein